MNAAVTPGRRIMGRLAKGEDLLAALERTAQERGITFGGGPGPRGRHPGPGGLL
jgi:hypothetical protein